MFLVLFFPAFPVWAQILPNPYQTVPEIRKHVIFEQAFVDGEPIKNVGGIVQDEKGFLWFNGGPNNRSKLIRYDGRALKEFQPITLTHSDATIWSICSDHEGFIWLATHGNGLQRFDPRSETFEVFDLNPQDTLGNSPRIYWTVKKDSRGRLWVGSRGEGLYMINAARDSIANFRHDPKDTASISGDKVLGNIFEDSKGRIWVCTQFEGLNLFDVSSGTFQRILFQTEGPEANISNTPFQFYEDDFGRIWITTLNGVLVILNPEDLSFQRYFHDPADPTSLSRNSQSIFGDSHNNLWITSDVGIDLYTPDEGLVRFSMDDKRPHSISGAAGRFFEDQKGTMWIPTNNGLNKIDPFTNNFEYIAIPHFIENQEEKETAILGVLEDRSGKLWLEAMGIGLYLYDPQTKETQLFTHQSGDANTLSENGVWSWLLDRNDVLWVRTASGLDFYDPQKGFFQRYCLVYPDQCAQFKRAQSLIEDREGFLWMGENGSGLYRMDPHSRKMQQYPYEPDNPDGLGIHLINNIAEDRHGNLWLQGEGGGLHWFKPETAQFKRLLTSADLPDGFDPKNLIPLFTDQENYLWFSRGKGPVRTQVDPEGKIIEIKFFTTPGWAHVEFSMDFSGRLWKETNDWFAQFDPEKGLLDRIYFNNMTPYPTSLVGHSRSGAKYWGDKLGLYRFHPDKAQRNDTPPITVLTDLQISRKTPPVRGSAGDTLERPSPLLQPIAYANSIKLNYLQNDLTFSFAVLNYSEPETNQYKYFLENYKQDTVYTDAEETTALYANLDPGRYVFKVWGANNEGVWSAEPASLQITILPPWWQSIWAYALYALLAGLAVWGLIRWRTRVHRLKLAEANLLNDRLQQVDQLKDQFLANTSHELRTPLHGMIGLAESLFEEIEKDDQKENLGMLIASGKRLSSLVNDLLDFSKVKNQDLQLAQKPIGLRPLVEVVLRACSPLAGLKPIELNNDVPGNLPAVYADEDRLQQILYNLIGNSIKFTEKGHIIVGARPFQPADEEKDLASDFIQVFVEDTGIGVPEDKKEVIFQSFEQGDGSTAREFGGTGLGLAITRQLVELHGGRIWVESQPDKGATFFFTLPASTEAAVALAKPAQDLSRTSLFSGLKKTSAPAPEISLAANAQDAVRILLVDDEPVNHQVIKNYLKSDHIYLQSAMSGGEALETIRGSAKFDLVLLDVMMPRMSGYEVCQKIRERYLPSEMPVIMVTAKGQVADLIQGLDTGANDYITKPFSKDEFLARIKTHLNLHRIHSATNKFVPSDFLKTIDRNNITEVRLGDQKEQNITVFFSDIRSYTSLSEGMTPDENFKFVNAYAGRMGPIIRENQGFVNQYLGDGIMALFQHEPKDALQAAVDMQIELQEYNRQREQQGRQPIRVGMGMHTGSLIMGVIGDDMRNDPATISDTVNTAARMEGLTKHFGAQILLSETVYAGLQLSAGSNSGHDSKSYPESAASYRLRYLGLVQVKGKKQPLGVYECLDGLPPDRLELMLKTLPDFEAGMRAYFSRQFEEAGRAFQRVLEANPSDKAAQLYAARCASYRLAGVADDWTGVETMSSK